MKWNVTEIFANNLDKLKPSRNTTISVLFKVRLAHNKTGKNITWSIMDMWVVKNMSIDYENIYNPSVHPTPVAANAQTDDNDLMDEF